MFILQALEVAKDCEQRLEQLKAPLAELKSETDIEFDKVNVARNSTFLTLLW